MQHSASGNEAVLPSKVLSYWKLHGILRRGMRTLEKIDRCRHQPRGGRYKWRGKRSRGVWRERDLWLVCSRGYLWSGRRVVGSRRGQTRRKFDLARKGNERPG